MELLANHVPTVVYYKISKFAHFAQRFFRRTRFITLVNILGVDHFTPGSPYYSKKMKIIPAYPTERDIDDMLFPEFLTSEDISEEAADSLLAWLNSPGHYDDCKERLRILHNSLNPVVNPFRIAANVLLKHAPYIERNDGEDDHAIDEAASEEEMQTVQRQTA
jgi:lipid A disaccharide synthetase